MSAQPASFIPKESLSAYQRWELDSLLPSDTPAANDGRVDEEAERTRLAQVERNRAAAQEQARAAGRVEGLASAAADVMRMGTLLEGLNATVRDDEQLMADAVLDLALAIARKIAGDALAVRRDLVIPVISAALAELPETTRRVRLHLAPEDTDLVRTLLDAHPGLETCQLVADANVSPGGFLLETDQCAVDGTLEARWQRLVASLGRSYQWVDHG